MPKESPPHRTLFDFSEKGADREWLTVNDGVMGGVSEGRFRIGEDGMLEFTGVLSLENNGGFASVRSRENDLGLRAGDVLVARVRGDGREYALNLYVPGRMPAFSYRFPFETRKDEWIDVRVPLGEFRATSFGRPVPGAAPVEAATVNSIGFLLADKNAGPFRLVVDTIRVER